MKQYHDMLFKAVYDGDAQSDRTGVGTRSIFGEHLRFNLQDGLPVLTTKRVHLKSVIAELLWMIAGETNVRQLQARGATIWDEWSDADGNLGPVYGAQWRRWGCGVQPVEGGSGGAVMRPVFTDQLADVVCSIKENPTSRRHIVSAWNVGDLPSMALPPCHLLFQFRVSGGRLSCQMYQRSADIFLGLPFNIASYAILTHMVAHTCDLDVGELCIAIGDAHVYHNHLDQSYELLSRRERVLPKISLAGAPRDLFAIDAGQIVITGYDPHPAIKAEVAV